MPQLATLKAFEETVHGINKPYHVSVHLCIVDQNASTPLTIASQCTFSIL